MKDLLLQQARLLTPDALEKASCEYQEHIEPDYYRPLSKNCSYIYGVAALALVDGNKADWAYIYLGLQRGEGTNPQYLGCIKLVDGENMDCGRVLPRLLSCIRLTHPMFAVQEGG